jgi:hypothetical protein
LGCLIIIHIFYYIVIQILFIINFFMVFCFWFWFARLEACLKWFILKSSVAFLWLQSSFLFMKLRIEFFFCGIFVQGTYRVWRSMSLFRAFRDFFLAFLVRSFKDFTYLSMAWLDFWCVGFCNDTYLSIFGRISIQF